MYCTNCGVHLEDNVSFCPNCGYKAARRTQQAENIMDQLNTGYQQIISRPKSRIIAGIKKMRLTGRTTKERIAINPANPKYKPL